MEKKLRKIFRRRFLQLLRISLTFLRLWMQIFSDFIWNYRQTVRMLWLLLQDCSPSFTGLIFLKMRTKLFRLNLACHKCQSGSLFHNFINLPGQNNLWIQQLIGDKTNDDYVYNLKALSPPLIWEQLLSLFLSLFLCVCPWVQLNSSQTASFSYLISLL